MRKITVEYTKVENGCYTVYLERGNKHFFTSEKECKKWVASYKDLFEINVYALNEIASRIYTMYRTNYFDFDDRHSSDISNEITSFESNITRIFAHLTSNTNSVALNAIKSCYWNLTEATYHMNNWAVQKKRPVLNSQTRMLAFELDGLFTRFKSHRESLQLPIDGKRSIVKKLTIIHNKNVDNKKQLQSVS